jgi:hypothetical protein
MSQVNQVNKAYIGTFTGKKFFLLKPRLVDIDIRDIAHGLAMQCRWTGQCKHHYSIAQHCYYCSFLGPEAEALDRLLHDVLQLTRLTGVKKPLFSILFVGSLVSH